MPTLDFSENIIDFAILENNNPKTIVLFDQSNYLTAPQLPIISVVPPGYTGRIEFAYTPSSLITIDSDVLNFTDSTTYADLAFLEDGVYQITMMICPYNEFHSKKCYLKTTQFEQRFNEFLLRLDVGCGCIDEKKLKEELINIDILLQSAKAEVYICNVARATEKFRVACRKLADLTKKLNCR